MKITEEQAICMFFYVDYTIENAEKYKKEIESFGEVVLCYNTDPKQPILTTLTRIRENPFSYHLYPADTSLKEQT
jgi:hypothetical protein